jgi:hypothetical protein
MKKNNPNHEDITQDNLDFSKLFGWNNEDP